MTDEEKLTPAERETLDYLHGYHFTPAYEGGRRNLEPTADIGAPDPDPAASVRRGLVAVVNW